MKLSKLVLGLLAAFLAVPVAAQSTYQAQNLVKSVSAAQIADIVKSLGHSASLTSGKKYWFSAKSSLGMAYLVRGNVCDKGAIAGCRGLLLITRFPLGAGKGMADVNKVNADMATIAAWASTDGKSVFFRRYLVLDHGVTMANLRANISEFEAGVLSAMRNLG